MNEAVLTYDHVEVSYGGRPVVHDVSARVLPGHVLGIVGESGSGKSTLVKAAMGLLGSRGMVTRGRILYRGSDLVDLPKRELCALCGPDLGMVFQDCLAALTPIRTIGDQLYEAVSAHGPAAREQVEARARELLARVNIADPLRVLASYPFELSGGMGQRVGIVMAMMLEPRVLLADEPTSALDVVSQKLVLEEFLELKRQTDTAIVLVTHNIGVVRALADEVLVLKAGEVMEQGAACEVLGNPASAYTRGLLEAVPVIEGRAR